LPLKGWFGERAAPRIVDQQDEFPTACIESRRPQHNESEE
jgi:hypothetical protein